MSSSELSNALNPHVVAHRTRRRHAAHDLHGISAVPEAIPAIPPVSIPQPTVSVPHRSELELAITAPPPPPLAKTVPVVQQQPPAYNAPPLVQEFYRLMAHVREVATVEKMRRLAWEHQQQARNIQAQAEVERQILDMRQELSMLKAYVTLHPNMTPPAECQQGQSVETFPTTARIESISPPGEPYQQPLVPVSPVPHHPMGQQPMFVEGSSSSPLTTQSLYFISPAQTPAVLPAGSPLSVAPSTLQSPQSMRPSPTPALLSPPPETISRKRPRYVREDDSDSDSDSEDTDSPPTDRPSKRKNGHDGRCLTIHHAMRIHIRKLMKLKHGEGLPESAFEGAPIPVDQPVRLVWHKTTKQSTTNAAMKKRIISDLKASRDKYKHVADKEFARKNLEAAFEQVFTTLRQKFKSQKDTRTAMKSKRREETKALKARRAHRKKAKLGNRTESRKKFDAFSQPIFDGALQPECMSSEESDGEQAEANGETMQVFRTRGLSWRSARLRRFYAILDEQDRFEKSTKPQRGPARRLRCEGAPKEGLFIPPKGIARWMVSRRWLQEMEAMRPDLSDILRGVIIYPTEAELDPAQLLLGSETSDDESNQGSLATDVYAHVSNTSYSLFNALQPVS